MLVAHAVMIQPRLQVGEDEMAADTPQRPGSCLGDGEVFVAALGEAGIAGPIDDRRTRSSTKPQSDSALRSGTTASRTSGVATALPLIELGSRLALSHFNGAGDKKLAPALAARAAADPGRHDMVAGLAADSCGEPYQRGACGGSERRFRNGKARWRWNCETCRASGGNQIGRPEPSPSDVWERSMTVPAVSTFDSARRRAGFAAVWQWGQTNPSPHRAFSR